MCPAATAGGQGEGARNRPRCPAAHSPAVKDRSTYNGAQRPARGVGPRGPTLHARPRPRRVRHRCPPGPSSGSRWRPARGGRPAAVQMAARAPTARPVGQRLGHNPTPSGGLALTQESSRIPLRAWQGGRKAAAGRRQAEQPRALWQGDARAFGESPGGCKGVAAAASLQEQAGAAKPLTSRSGASGKAPRGDGGERKPPHGQSAAAPVPSLLSPLGGDEVRQGATSIRARCQADGGQERRLAA
jgi:hypothetical protein